MSKAVGAHVASHHLMCLSQAHTHTHKNRHARVCCWAESPLRPQSSVDATMCLKLTLEPVTHVSFTMWPSLSLPPHLFSSMSSQTTPLFFSPPPHRGEPQEVDFKKLRKTKHLPEKMDFPKSYQHPRVSHGEPNHLQRHDRHVFWWFSSSYWAGYSHKMEQTTACCYWQPSP